MVISANASAIPCPLLAPELAPTWLFLALDVLPSRLDPSTFPLRSLYKVPIVVDLFNLVLAFFARSAFATPIGGGGGGGANPFGDAIGGGGTDDGNGVVGVGGGEGTSPFIGGGGGAGGAN